MELVGVYRGISTYKTNISETGYGDLRSGQFCDLAIIRQCENVKMPLKNDCEHYGVSLKALFLKSMVAMRFYHVPPMWE